MPAERKSTRLANRPPPKVTVLSDNDESEYTSDESDSDSEVDEDEIFTANKRGGGTKRKSKASSSTKQPASKKPRGMRGLLKDVVDMPLDVIYEIFGHVLPVDLLNLARTSKDLRKIIMNRSSAFVWRNARANDPHGLPDCPSDISEPAYASLCYAKHCTSCNCATPSPYHIFDARIRLCRKCVDKKCSRLHGELNTTNFSKIKKILPKIELAGQPLHKRYVFYTPVVEKLQRIMSQIAKKHKDSTARTAELTDHKFVKQLKKKHRHAVACAKWLKNRSNDKEAEKTSLLESRRAEVVDYAKGLGWSEELFNFVGTIEAIQKYPPITKVCGKKITPQALEGIKAVLTNLLDDIKLDHTAWKITHTLTQWLPLLDNIRRDCSRAFHPNVPVISTRDLFHLPAVHDLIMGAPLDVTVTAESLDHVRENFAAYMSEWQKQQKETLLKMIDAAYDPKHAIDKDNIFDLATTSFRCKDCTYFTIRLTRALVHSCAVRYPRVPNDKLSFEEKEEAAVACDILAEPRWNEYKSISFDKSMAAILGDVVEFCGFDPKSTTADEMDLANPILECVSCNDIYRGRTTMNWSTTAYHYYSCHSNSGHANSSQSAMVLKAVEEPEASYVRSQMNILKEKAYSAQHTERCVCVECHLAGNMPTLKAHWKAVHGRLSVDGDILPQLDMVYNPEEFMLWPPRDPDTLTSGTVISLTA